TRYRPKEWELAPILHSRRRSGQRGTQVRRHQHASQEEAQGTGGDYGVLYGLRRIAGLRALLPRRRLHVLGHRRGPPALRPHRGRSLSLHRLQEVPQQGPRRLLPGRLPMGRHRDGGYRRSGKGSRPHGVLSSSPLVFSPPFFRRVPVPSLVSSRNRSSLFTEKSTLLFSSDSALFAQNTRDGGTNWWRVRDGRRRARGWIFR